MSKARSWSVKGIDQDTRALARRAAKAAGMTIGGWIDHAIRQAAFKAAQDAERQRVMGAASYPVSQPRPYDLREPPMAAPHAETLRRALAATRSAPADARAEPVAAEAARPALEVDDGDPPAAGADALDDELEREPTAVSVKEPGSAGRRRYARPMIVGLVALAVVGAAGATLWWVSASNVRQALNRTPPEKERPAAPGPVATAPAASPRSTPGAADEEAPPAAEQPPGAAPATAMTEIQRLLGAARQGSPQAQLALGQAYATGNGIAKDDVAANRWLESAAQQGVVAAQLALAERYASGVGQAADPALAAFWYRKAADNGEATAAYGLGRAYADGSGVPRSAETAARWYERAAAAGNAEAMVTLAKMYDEGTGVPRDPARAVTLYRDAALAGNAEARERLSRLANAEGPPSGAPRPAAMPKPKPARTASLPAVVAPPPPAPAAPALTPAPPTAAARAPAPPAAAGAPVRVAKPSAPAPRGPAAAGRMPKAAVAEIQRLLRQLDFQPGPPDGNLGPRTVKAIRQYQVFAGLEATGAASPALLDELREIVRTLPKKAAPVSR